MTDNLPVRERWHAGRIIYALAHRYYWRQNLLMTEFDCDRGRADLVMISRAGYLTEFEIKVSLSDWQSDRTKRKFAAARPHVSRFFYAVPETLENRVPEWLPAEAGLLVIRRSNSGSHDDVHEVRAARRLSSRKVPEQWGRRLIENCYYRFWNAELQRLGRQIDRRRLSA